MTHAAIRWPRDPVGDHPVGDLDDAIARGLRDEAPGCDWCQDYGAPGGCRDCGAVEGTPRVAMREMTDEEIYDLPF